MSEMFIETVKLTVPVTLKGVEFSELKVPIPRGKDLRLLPMDPKRPSDFFPLLCSCLGITDVREYGQLCLSDRGGSSVLHGERYRGERLRF